VPSSKAVNHQT